MSGQAIEIEQAIEALRQLPTHRQQELASYIYHLATDYREPESIDPADAAAVSEGTLQAKLRQFASPGRIAQALGSNQK